jgi:hypothetical protein
MINAVNIPNNISFDLIPRLNSFSSGLENVEHCESARKILYTFAPPSQPQSPYLPPPSGEVVGASNPKRMPPFIHD